MEFDPYEVLGYVKALSFPRRTGSTGEAQAQEYIVSRFKALGMEPEVEEFSFTPILGLLSKGFLLIVLLSLTALHLLSPFYPFLGVTLSLYILILTLGFLWGRPVVALLGWALFKELPLIRKLHSKNIMASWPSEFGMWNSEFGISNPQSAIHNPQSEGHSPEPATQIYILAHYDSKSQTLPIGGRIPLVMALFLSTLSLSAYHLLVPLAGLHVPGAVDRAIFITALTSGLVLLWTKTRNLSPGAIDNASGVALMLHLAEAISRDVQSASGGKGLRFHFVATGAEEEGLAGAFWLRKSLDRGDPTGRPYFINLDGVGTKGSIYCTDKIGLHPSSQGQKEFLSLIRRAAEAVGSRCNVPLQVYSPPITMGAMADHFPFIANGYRAVTFSTVSRRSLWVHTPWDTLEMVEVEGMEAVGRLILGVLRLLK
ncbi:MAG TPA: M28 family peptidase [Candidatus Brocadiales bacterium]|nr:M28 family peptidase [Candidatus Brocadiales bacterium]